MMASHQTLPPKPPKKTFVLCFDGTGNKFANAPSDSNILKIFRMIDKNQGAHHFHYYQPGIGTYADTKNLTHTSLVTRFRSWFAKAKDSAVGASVDQHIVAGYKFLMAHYSVGDDIYMFGFSRGAYIARFLAEMIDNVGLLSTGNDEMVYFAWKTLLRWQTRTEATEEEKIEKDKLFAFMKGFRETFSRPVRRLRFLGLFDTVNSIPRFESALFERSRFPYSCQTSAKVIRHAVSINERRVKFRQDLISDAARKNAGAANAKSGVSRLASSPNKRKDLSKLLEEHPEPKRNPYHERLLGDNMGSRRSAANRAKSPRYRAPSRRRDVSNVPSRIGGSAVVDYAAEADDDSESEGEDQDIEEVWFPGCHADIGGGWAPSPGEKELLSHTPLVWMVNEAQKAGVKFDIGRLREFHCVDDQLSDFEWANRGRPAEKVPPRSDGLQIPRISIDEPPEGIGSIDHRVDPDDHASIVSTSAPPEASQFRQRLLDSCQTGLIHDCLDWRGGLGFAGTMAWKAFELLPFKRMDLQPDGSWRPIRLPLPLGEPRDAPFGSKVHASAIRRMEADPNYRPGCIIVGGGGRGVRKAPSELGIGKWRVLRCEGDPVQEVYVRADIEERQAELARRLTDSDEKAEEAAAAKQEGKMKKGGPGRNRNGIPKEKSERVEQAEVNQGLESAAN